MVLRLVTVILVCHALLRAQFVPSGHNSIEDLHRFAGELRSNQRILFVMFAPSDADVELITRARLTQRARVHMAFLTNGDGVMDGEGMPYPHQTAARWREHAYDLASAAGAGHSFLNLPYIDAASSEDRVRIDWPADTVRLRWRQLLADEKPDAVLITGFEHLPPEHPLLRVFLADVASAAKRAIRSGGWVPLQIAVASGQRRADRSAGSDAANELLEGEHLLRRAFTGRLLPPETRRTYQVFEWRKDSVGSSLPLSRLFPSRRVPDTFASLDSALQAFSGRLLRLRSRPEGKKREDVLVSLVDAMQQIDLGIAQISQYEDEPRRFLLDWKLALESIRGTLLDVRVSWRLTERILTEKQLTHFAIDSIRGLDPKGRTEIFFPEVRNGWVINEQQTNRYPYKAGEEYRMFTLQTIPYDLPRSLIGLSREEFRTPWYVFVVHQATTAEYSFSYRIDLGLLGAPRFSPEVLTPIVRAVDGEEVIVRLTNHSRDGVYDSVYAAGTLVRSTRAGFRLMEKDASETDTIRLDWSDAPTGPYLVNVMIAGEPVANFLARRFAATSTKGKPVTIVGDPASSALLPALKRLGYAPDVVSPKDLRPGVHSPVLVDEQILRVRGITDAFWKNVAQVAEEGAHVLVFSQEAEVLAGSGLFQGVRFTPTFDADTSYSIALTGSSELLRHPNDLTDGTWDGWIYRVASNRIRPKDQSVTEHARFEGSGDPVIFTVRRGRGAVTYIDLNLSPQWVNVLPAAYTLLANLVEDEGLMGEEK